MSESFGPLMEVARIQAEINRLFENVLDLGRPDDDGSAAWIPNVDVIEAEEELVVRVELPGVALENLNIATNGSNLIIRGEKTRPAFGGDSSFLAAERGFGVFRRVVHLAVPVNTRRAEAVLDAGLLEIRFPKVPNRRGEEVPIEVKNA